MATKTGERPKAKFKAGDRVRVGKRCEPFPGHYAVGDEVDMLCTPGRPEYGYRAFWEYLLAAAK